jgi:hypothetical protein
MVSKRKSKNNNEKNKTIALEEYSINATEIISTELKFDINEQQKITDYFKSVFPEKIFINEEFDNRLKENKEFQEFTNEMKTISGFSTLKDLNNNKAFLYFGNDDNGSYGFSVERFENLEINNITDEYDLFREDIGDLIKEMREDARENEEELDKNSVLELKKEQQKCERFNRLCSDIEKSELKYLKIDCRGLSEYKQDYILKSISKSKITHLHIVDFKFYEDSEGYRSEFLSSICSDNKKYKFVFLDMKTTLENIEDEFINDLFKLFDKVDNLHLVSFDVYSFIEYDFDETLFPEKVKKLFIHDQKILLDNM